MVEYGECQRGDYEHIQQSFALTFLIVVIAFIFGVISSHLITSIFGLLVKVKIRSPGSVDDKKHMNELPLLPTTVNRLKNASDPSRGYFAFSHQQFVTTVCTILGPIISIRCRNI